MEKSVRIDFHSTTTDRKYRIATGASLAQQKALEQRKSHVFDLMEGPPVPKGSWESSLSRVKLDHSGQEIGLPESRGTSQKQRCLPLTLRQESELLTWSNEFLKEFKSDPRHCLLPVEKWSQQVTLCNGEECESKCWFGRNRR